MEITIDGTKKIVSCTPDLIASLNSEGNCFYDEMKLITKQHIIHLGLQIFT
jgi:hypothetical protein